jgi:hypothetical protein
MRSVFKRENNRPKIIVSQANQSHCACPSPAVVEIPGSPGNNGTAGIAGGNSFSITQANFVVPAISGTVTVTVDDNRWMQVNQIVFESASGYYQVASLSGTTVATLTYLNYPANTAAGNTVNTGAQISPAGSQPSLTGLAASGANSDITSLTGLTTPLSIAQGGTGAATAVAALAALGVVLTLTSAVANGVTPVSVAETSVTADSAIIFTLKTVGGTVGAYPAIQTITPSTGFTFKATAADTSTYNILIVN